MDQTISQIPTAECVSSPWKPLIQNLAAAAILDFTILGMFREAIIENASAGASRDQESG